MDDVLRREQDSQHDSLQLEIAKISQPELHVKRVAQAIDGAPKLAKRAKTDSKPTPSNVHDIAGSVDDRDHGLSNQAQHQDLFDDPDGDPWFDRDDPDPGDTLSMPCS